MLVLSRKPTQIIMVGDDITIEVLDVRGDKVRLGITAPPNITIHRKEIYDGLKQANDLGSNAKIIANGGAK